MKNKKQEHAIKQKAAAPRWAVIALIAAWGLLAILIVGALIWQFAGRASEDEGDGPAGGSVVDSTVTLYTYEMMEEDLRELCRLYPQRIRMGSAGKSADGREIWYADVGPEHAPRQFFLSAGIHGREYMTPLLAMEMIEAELTEPTAEDCLFRVVPMANPDGIVIAQKGPDGIRSEELRGVIRKAAETDMNEYASYRETYGTEAEYFRHWKANARGVDLNRNFPIEYWTAMTTGIPHPSSQKYKGPSAGSESETQALMALLEAMDEPEAVISLHSQGEILYWDCGQTGTVREKNRVLVNQIADMTGYRRIDQFTNPDATLDDWAALVCGIPSVNVEVGKGNVLLPREQWETIWNQTKNLWRLLATGSEEAT